MPEASLETVLDILKDDADGVLRDWIDQAEEDGAKRTDLFSEKEERDQAGTMLRAFRSGIKDTARDGDFNLEDPHWADLRGILSEITHERVERGVLPGEMAGFVLALKTPLFSRLMEKLAGKPDQMLEEVLLLSKAIDAFALYTNEVFIAEREAVIERQREEMARRRLRTEVELAVDKAEYDEQAQYLRATNLSTQRPPTGPTWRARCPRRERFLIASRHAPAS